MMDEDRKMASGQGSEPSPASGKGMNRGNPEFSASPMRQCLGGIASRPAGPAIRTLG